MGLLQRIFNTRSVPKAGDSFDVTGEWSGYYTQYDEKRPIIATFMQVGNRFSGSMSDIQTESERSLFDAALEAGMPPGTDEKIDEIIRQMIPDAGNDVIRAKAILPEKSQIEGVVDGSFVRFTKVYQGQHFVGYQIGDKRIGQVVEGHSVQYSGRVSDDGRSIEGRWTIYQPDSPRRYVEGLFALQKT